MSPSASPRREIRELPAGETELAHSAIRALRPDQKDAHRFAEYVDIVLRPAGLRLIGVFVPGHEQAVALASFRVGDSLAWGHYMYIDDLCTVPDARRQGHGEALVDWLLEESRRLECDQVHLDSGLGPDRFDAHRLYHARGFSIYSHHFARGP